MWNCKCRPGNLIFDFDSDDEIQTVNVIDWEFATMAPAFIDIGHFIAEVFMNNYFEARDDVYIHLLDSLLASYSPIYQSIQVSEALFYAGAHIGCFAPRRASSKRSRATKETCLSCINQAIALMKRHYEKTTASQANVSFVILLSMMRERRKEIADCP